ncbi:MAG: peptide chain release factor N(5)-glutamine methyltransferase [Ruminococcaceae bacterium]|nr:peptide chain release factor N(5)-glutamine methyltransferase [Oscillospiraceae bacterium]
MQFSEIITALAAAGIENPRFEAGVLQESFSSAALAEAVARRCTHYPLQYIVGEWDFYRETYEVTPDCLIPRADTETLVEAALRELSPKTRILDLCTGSGCVAISVVANSTDTTAVAVDLFAPTLALAARNARRNGVEERICFVQADVLQEPSAEFYKKVADGARFDAILSNPPYICDDVVPTLQAEVQHEPAAALRGGADGLDFYRSILNKWQCLLAEEGFFGFEIGYDQGEALRQLAAERGFSCTVLRDLGGCDRVALLRRQK